MSDDKRGHKGGVRVPRRVMLKSLAASAVFLDSACGAPPPETTITQRHPVATPLPIETPIRIENRLPGASTLPLSHPALAREVEGFATATSAIAGDTVEIKVSVDRTQDVHWELYRIGYYQGHGARLVTSGTALQVPPQPDPSINPHTGLIECAWDSAFSLVIDPNWVTGYYMVKLRNEAGLESYVPFIVRENGRRAALLAQASVTTWQAYNRWGGNSLYVNLLPASAPFTGPRAYQVSFDRPYDQGLDIGYVEHAMVRWLEQQGYDVAYVTNVDIDATPRLLEGRQLFASVGHDEYWSLPARNAVLKARDAGLSVAFFSGNAVYRRIRLERSSAGVPRRTITCYKSATRDPHRNARDTTNDFAAPPFPRPANELVGLVWTGGAQMDGLPFIVSNPQHWVYEGCGVEAGDSLGHIVGYEWDGVSKNGHTPAGLEVLAESPLLHEYGYASLAHASVYYPTPSSFVFAAGTTGWARGLSEDGLAEPRVQRATENILRRAGLFPEARVVLPPPLAQEPYGAARSVVKAGALGAGNADGPLATAQFRGPAGVAVGPNGELYVSDTGNHSVRKIEPDGRVSTLLGQGLATSLRLNCPTGIVADADGNVFVADTDNHRIVVIDKNGNAAVFAGGRSGAVDATDPLEARFMYPRGLALDESGTLFVADFHNSGIRRIDATGVSTVAIGLGRPTAVAVGPDGTLYYVATQWGSIVSLARDGTRQVLANPKAIYGDRSGPGQDARLRPADGLVYTESALLFTDTGNNRVRAVAFDVHNTVSTLLGSGRSGPGVGLGSETDLVVPRGLTRFGDGYVVADSANHRLLYFSTTPGLQPVR